MLSLTPLAKTAVRADLRFRLYCDAIQHHGAERMLWRHDVAKLLAAGVRVRRALHRRSRSQSGNEGQDALAEELDGICDALASADDWTRRLQECLDRLSPSGKLAFSELVRLGC